jgi:hypothetical protein
MLVFEDETTTITQKPCIRKSFSLEGEQQKIEDNGSSRNKFSIYISMLWPDKKLMYNFYEYVPLLHWMKMNTGVNYHCMLHHCEEKDVCANHNYQTEKRLINAVRKYLRSIGRWPKL